jgi:hypothetical protein
MLLLMVVKILETRFWEKLVEGSFWENLENKLKRRGPYLQWHDARM